MSAGLTRRRALALLAGTGALAFAGRHGGPLTTQAATPVRQGLAAREDTARTRAVTLVAQERPSVLPALPGMPLPLYLYGEAPFRTVRMVKGERLRASLVNRLAEHTSIHWHGVRVANGSDGVPWLTQAPTRPGERYDYDLVPPDAGTFFFHPHCDEIGQIGRGLEGLLIVENEIEPYATDHVLAIRDWRVDAATGSFLPISTDEGAAKAGTFGTLRTVNGAAKPNFQVPAGKYARIRLLALDPTRILDIAIDALRPRSSRSMASRSGLCRSKAGA